MTADDKVQIVPTPATDNNKFKILALVVILSLAVTVLALILACVAISKANGSGNEGVVCDCPSESGAVGYPVNSLPAGERIWMFQIGHFESVAQYLDAASGTIRGYNVDVVNAVCQLANKNCQLVFDLYERCWDSEAGQRARGGIGLMGKWYDTCVGWAHSYDRARTMLFSDEFEKAIGDLIVTTGMPGVTTLPSDFTGMTIGFLDGWISDEHCMARFDNFPGFDQNDPDQVKHYTTEPDLVAALTSQEIDFAFHANFSYIVSAPGVNEIWDKPIQRCLISGVSLMMTKDQLELKNWWDAAFARLKVTSEYEAICDRVSVVHGEQPGLEARDICPR